MRVSPPIAFILPKQMLYNMNRTIRLAIYLSAAVMLFLGISLKVAHHELANEVYAFSILYFGMVALPLYLYGRVKRGGNGLEIFILYISVIFWLGFSTLRMLHWYSPTIMLWISLGCFATYLILLLGRSRRVRKSGFY